MWGLFVGAAAAVLAPIGPGALVPLKLAIASADSVGNDVYVAVVVDFGNGSSMTTVSKCVPVASNARDTDALAAAVGSSNVSYASSGLLCVIDNYPANGVQNCGQSVGNADYDFWSYWHGSSGSWVYANNGPAGQSVSSPSNDVEGWRFQNDEPASSSDPPPGVAPSYAQICNASTEVPPAGSSSGPAPTTTTMANASPGPSVTPTTVKTAPGSAETPTTAPAANSRTTSHGGSATSSTARASGSTTTTVSPSPSPSSAGAASGSDAKGNGSSDARHIADASAAAHGGSGGSSSAVLPALLIAAVVVVLGAYAFFRWRRRPAEE